MSADRPRKAGRTIPLVRQCLVALGFVLIALTPLVGPIPGPGGIIVFGAGLSLILKYTRLGEAALRPVQARGTRTRAAGPTGACAAPAPAGARRFASSATDNAAAPD